MPAASPARTNFTGGEWSKRAQGRFDRDDYRTALNVCLNWVPLESGAMVRRPGTQHARTTRGGAPGRVARWDFKQTAAYTIEFTAGFMRFRLGAALATTNDDQAIVAISTANPAVVQTSAASGWATGNTVQFANLGAAMPLLQARLFTITTVDSTHFSLTDAMTGANIDGSTLGTLPGGATVQRIQEVASPYSGTLWQQVRIIQAETQAILLHPTVPPQILTASPPPVGQTYWTFSLSPGNLVDGPYLDVPTNGVEVLPSAQTGIITLSLQFQGYSSTTAYSKGDFVLSSAVNYQSLKDQNVNNTPASSPTFWTAVAAGIAINSGHGFQGSDVGRLIRIQRDDKGWAWGKITGISNQISGTLAGSVNIGNMTANGGLSAAFDGNTTKNSSACAAVQTSNLDPANCFVGKNYTGASAQVIGQATLWESQDVFFGYATKTYTTTTQTYFWNGTAWAPFGSPIVTPATIPTSVNLVTINLRAKQSAPAFPADGTLLGSAVSTGAASTTIVSNDQATAWNYVWFHPVFSGIDKSVPPPVDTRLTSPQVIGTVAFTQSSVLNSFTTYQFVAQAQFFNPPSTGAAGSAVTFQLLGGTTLDATTARLNWRLGAWSNTTGWPTCGTYSQGRLWLAGAIDNRTDATDTINLQTQPFNMAPTDATLGTVLDSSAITAVFNAADVNAIFWMEEDAQGIIVGTQAGAWLIQASALNNPITPTSIQAHRVDRIGSANIEPVRAAGPLIVVHRYTRKLFEYFNDVFSGRLAPQHLTWKNQHMTKPGIAEVRYQNELAPIIWSRCADGSLFGMIYKREKLMTGQEPDFAGGFRTALGSLRVVESIAVGPSVDGTLDALTMVTNDPATGIRHVEVLTNLTQEGDPPTTWWLLDDAVAPTSTTAITAGTVINSVTFVNGGLTLNGLWHLNNKTVSVFACGLDCGDWPVVNGSVQMSYGDGISAGTGGGFFTAALVASFANAVPIVVGFGYISDGQLTRPLALAESGSRSGPALGMKRRGHQYAVLVENTVGGVGPEGSAIQPGIRFGTVFEFTKLHPAIFRTADDITALPYGTPFTGVYWDTLDDVSSFDGMLCWRVARPVAATVVAVETFLQTQDKG